MSGNKNITSKKRYICDNSKYLTTATKMGIGSYFLAKNKKIKESMDGCRINLDLIEDELINHIYDIVFNNIESNK